ncbi:MAG TPA: carboxypeptidase M32 [Verrucomicrobiae bacterium]|nr:carboxypeptidase M32 [Verrucomicrobiae bacterium]
MEAKLEELKQRLAEINDVRSAAAVLSWDQMTYMPPGGAEARGRQMATLEQIAHEKLTHPSIGRMLTELRSREGSLPADSDEAALIRVARRDYDRAVKVPPAFVAKFSAHQTATYEAWVKARPANDFAAVRPYLEKTLEYSRELANYFPGYDHIADPLIDFADFGMKAATIRALFAELRRELVPLVQAITAQPLTDDACLRQNFPEAQQLAFGSAVVKQLGYDFQRGRQDKTHHPFCTTFSLGDVRITTRVKENDLGDALFSTIHEAGHAMYEQGIRGELEGTPLARGTSSGVHESQSRLWENLVGRGRGFWRFFYPELQAAFPVQLSSVPLDVFYRAINKVERSLIRTDADEVTYNLHVMIRFDFELQLLEGKLAVRDLPEAWRERYKADLGIASPDDRDGVLQDVHWFGGQIGGVFQGYTLGNILSAQFYDAALRANSQIPDQIASGEFTPLHAWLQENIYQHGAKFTANELVKRATGQPLSIEPYIRYLRTKYGELYKVV